LHEIRDVAAGIAEQVASRRDRGRDELVADLVRFVWIVGVGRKFRTSGRVDIAGENHRISDLLGAERVEELLALVLVAVPHVGVDESVVEVDRGDDRLLADRVPDGLRVSEAVDEPRELFVSQHRLLR
jgi:hypothetical protein